MTLRVEGLSKQFGETVALDDVSFEIPDGALAVVLGESGAGKSTLLRVINGLTTPTAGEVYIDGERTTGSRSDVAMVFQQHNLVDEMSAFGNALTGGLGRTGFLRSLFQQQSDAEKARALEALDTVGLLDEADQQVMSMSGGQQQRVGIARALVQQPGLLIADEPVASLDPSSAETVMEYLGTVADERSLTTLASLHQVNIAREFGQWFVGLRDGELVFSGGRDQLDTAVLEKIYGEIETDEIRDGTATDADVGQRDPPEAEV
jgi:phosphonate transport system ATP-binding protein